MVFYIYFPSGGAEEQWEKDLEAELNDYEVLNVDAERRQRVTAQTIGTGASQESLKVSISSGERSGTDKETVMTDYTVLGSSGGGGTRTRTTNNDWEEYADLIEDTDDLK